VGVAAAGGVEALGGAQLSTSVPKVFISYRREETAGHAGRLYDAMSSRFGNGNVFMDVDMAPGVDFVQRIKDAVGGCHVLLVIIGPRWSTITDGAIAPRLADPDDFVRLEVEEGLRRANVTVIPVLVGGARMPEPSELPRELHSLSRRNALELSDTRWRYDVDRLLAHLDGLLGIRPAAASRPAPNPTPTPTPVPLPPAPPRRTPGVTAALVAALVAAVAGLVGRAIIGSLSHRAPPYTARQSDGSVDWPSVPTSERIDHILDPVIWGAFTWAIVGLAVVVWLSIRVHGSFPPAGRLVTGVIVAGAGGALGPAIFAGVPHLMKNSDGKPSRDHHDLLLILGVAVTGAIVGAVAGWCWKRRGSAGFAVGLLAGGLWEVFLVGTGWSGSNDQIAKATLGAAFIVGLVALSQVALDARASPAPA
jgi:TIR domain